MHENQQTTVTRNGASLASRSAWATSQRTLRATLESMLTRFFGGHCDVVDVSRRISPYSTSFTLEELDVTLQGGARLELMSKNLGWGSLLPEARRVRPHFLYAPLREIQMYQHVLDPAEIGTPICFGTSCDVELDRYLLVLERVRSAKLCHEGDFEIWLAAARWLADTHTRLSKRVERLGVKVPLLEYDESFYRLWILRAFTNICRAGDRSPEARDVQWLAKCYERAVQNLVRLPRTVIHGEFYASNILVQKDRDDRADAPRLRICPVDWEMAACAPGMIDLAALVSGRWTAEQREAMAMAYYDALARNHAAAMSRADFRRALEYCRLHLAMQWVGWAADWSPPDDQARNWLQEATDIARHLGW